MVITSQGQSTPTKDKTVRQQDPPANRAFVDPKPIPPGGGTVPNPGQPIHPGTLEGGVPGPDLPMPGEGHPAVLPSSESRSYSGTGGLDAKYQRDEKGRITEGGKVVNYGSAQPMVLIHDRPESILADVVALSPTAKMPEGKLPEGTISISSGRGETQETHLVPYRGGYIVSGPLADKLAQHRGLIADQAIPGLEGMDLHPLKQEEVLKQEKPPGIVAPSRTYGGDYISEEEAEEMGQPMLYGQTRNVPIGDDPQNPTADVPPVEMTSKETENRTSFDKSSGPQPPMKASPPKGTSESPDKSKPSTDANSKK